MRLGKYTLVAPLGRGGMGGVWEIKDDAGNAYALKSPAGGMNPAAEATKRFAREANALRMLDHPNLVAAVDVFVEAGYLFLVMEYVRGRTLTKVMQAEGPIQARRALVIARQLLDGVGHAHAQGLVHRDLKPDNIMLVDMGGWERAKIVDFGLVKLIGDAEAAMGGGKLTSTGLVFGTPAYMAPEQALGKLVDGRADLYAAATILFEMLTGRVPFDHADPMMQMKMQVKAPPPRLDMLSKGAAWCTPQLSALIDAALAKDPQHRFPNAQVMMSALEDAFVSLDHIP
ncbi:MAG TPA: serine/threonine-protein kinase [Kofleriaceae bacterium]|nr:serine/threonine-protein kinase [Kofleriaceae bacterium]